MLIFEVNHVAQSSTLKDNILDTWPFTVRRLQGLTSPNILNLYLNTLITWYCWLLRKLVDIREKYAISHGYCITLLSRNSWFLRHLTKSVGEIFCVSKLTSSCIAYSKLLECCCECFNIVMDLQCLRTSN